jgi:hypothetical protein
MLSVAVLERESILVATSELVMVSEAVRKKVPVRVATSELVIESVTSLKRFAAPLDAVARSL